jgi:hypothetical protein
MKRINFRRERIQKIYEYGFQKYEKQSRGKKTLVNI